MDRLLLAFSLDRQQYAIRLMKVQQVLRMVEITLLPKAPEIVLGVVDLHGKVIPVLDVRRRFGLPKRHEIILSDQIVVADTTARTVGLVVDAVIGVVERKPGAIIEPQSIVPGIKHVEGVTTVEGDILFIHDLDRFLSLEEDEALEDLLTESGGAR